MARLFRGYPLIGIHRGLSRLAVSPTHFLIMLVDFFLYLQRWTTFYNVHAHDATKEGLSEWFSRRNEKQKGPLHKKNDISLQTLGQDGRGRRRRRNKKSFMCLITLPVGVSQLERETSLTVLHGFEKRSLQNFECALAVFTCMESQEFSAWRSNTTYQYQNKKQENKQPLKTLSSHDLVWPHSPE